MAVNESKARNAKQAKEIALKVANSFGDKNPRELAKQVRQAADRNTRR